MATAFRVVSYRPGEGLFTLAGGLPVTVGLGEVDSMDGAGLFLATSRQFCTDYYTGLTDDEDVLLTYAYEPADVRIGDAAQKHGEFTVSRAVLAEVENLSRPGADMIAELEADASSPRGLGH